MLARIRRASPATSGRSTGRATSPTGPRQDRRAHHRRSRARPQRASIPTCSISGKAWLEWTGLPFVFAAWGAAPTTTCESKMPSFARRTRRRAARSPRPSRSEHAPAAIDQVTRPRLPHRSHSLRFRRRREARGSSSSSAKSAEAGLLPAFDVRFTGEPSANAGQRRHVARARGLGRAIVGRRGDAARQRGLALRARARGRRRAQEEAPEGRRHVHRRSQRQLHERLHHELPLLRLLPAGRPPRGYVLSREVLGQKLQEVVDAGGVQILLQGGLNPELPHRAGTRISSAG